MIVSLRIDAIARWEPCCAPLGQTLGMTMITERPMSAAASQIAETKPKFWEYTLTGELIRDWVGPIARQYDDLQAGLYALPGQIVPGDACIAWVSKQLDAVSAQTKALTRLVDIELGRAWGDPGVPGSVDEIRRVCAYIADACGRLLAWEEVVRSVRTDDTYSEITSVLAGAMGGNIAEVLKVTTFIETVVSSGPGNYALNIVIALPDGWEDRFDAATERVRERLESGDV